MLVWRLTTRGMALLFAAFAALQLNDPDPALWAALYLVPAALSLFALEQAMVLATGLGYALLSAWWWNYGVAGLSCGELFGKIAWPEFFAAEPVRESVGLGLAAAWLLGMALWMWKHGKDRSPLEAR